MDQSGVLLASQVRRRDVFPRAAGSSVAARSLLCLLCLILVLIAAAVRELPAGAPAARAGEVRGAAGGDHGRGGAPARAWERKFIESKKKLELKQLLYLS